MEEKDNSCLFNYALWDKWKMLMLMQPIGEEVRDWLSVSNSWYTLSVLQYTTNQKSHTDS